MPIVPITAANLEGASLALASAFHDDPLLRYLIRDEATRRRTLPHVMRANLRLTLPEGYTHALTDESGDVIGAIGVEPPGGYPYSMARELRFTWEQFWYPRPWDPPLLQFLKGIRYQKVWNRLHIKEPHWYLYIIGVRADKQGQGYGAMLLKQVLEWAKGDTLPVYLETQTEKNLPFYGSFGFEILERVDLPGGGPPTWGLIKK